MLFSIENLMLIYNIMKLGNKHSFVNIISFILIILGIVLIVYNLWTNYRANAVKSWARVQATVISAFAAPANQQAGQAYLDPRQMIAYERDPARYKPYVVYSYQIGDRNYQSSSVAYGDGRNTYNSLEIKTLMSQIIPGNTIMIYVDPSNPRNAYIYTRDTNYWGSVLGLILLLIGGFLLYRSKNSWKRYADMFADKLSSISKDVGDINFTELDAPSFVSRRMTGGSGCGPIY